MVKYNKVDRRVKEAGKVEKIVVSRVQIRLPLVNRSGRAVEAEKVRCSAAANHGKDPPSGVFSRQWFTTPATRGGTPSASFGRPPKAPHTRSTPAESY